MTDPRLPEPPHDDVLERNVEGLLRRAYRPEVPDPAFVRRVESRLLAERGAAPAVSLGQRAGALAAAAALLAAMLGLSHRESRGPGDAAVVPSHASEADQRAAAP
jgi:hypothetical protein